MRPCHGVLEAGDILNIKAGNQRIFVKIALEQGNQFAKIIAIGEKSISSLTFLLDSML